VSGTEIEINNRGSLLRWTAILGLLCVMAGSAHFWVSAAGDDYSGPLLVFDRMFDLLLVGALGCVAFCLGRTISQALKLDFANLAEEVSVSVMVGVGVTASGILGLGLGGLLEPIPVGILMVGLLVLSRKQLPRVWAILNSTIDGMKTSREQRIVSLLFLAFVALLTIRALTPPHAVDEAIYHLPVTKSFVEQGRVHPVYDNFSGNLPLLVHMMYAVCLMVKADISAKLFSLFLAVISSLALYGFCARFLNRRTAVIALFGFFGGGMVVEVAVTSRVDVSLAGILFVAAYCMMIYLESNQVGWLFASALLAGFSIAVKYTAGVGVLLLGLMYLVECFWLERRPPMSVLRQGLAYAFIVIAVASPWLIKNQVWFENPVYPFITGELAEHGESGVRYFAAEDEARLSAHFEDARKEAPEAARQIRAELSDAASHRPERHPLRFWEYFTKSETYNLGIAESYQDPNYLFVVAPFALFLRRRKWLIWMAVIVILFYIFLASTSWIARYLLPLYPILTLLAAYSLTELADRLQARAPIARVLPVVAIVVAVGSTAFISAVQIYASATPSFIVGSLSRRNFMSASFYYPPLDFVNHNIPADGRVFMMGAQMSYDLERDYIADGGWDSIEWQRLLIRSQSLEQVGRELQQRGVTHILYSPNHFRFIALNGREGSGPSGSLFGPRDRSANPQISGIDYETQLRNWTTFDLFRSKFLESVQAFDDYEILKLKVPPGHE
jgi:4-amino-4-deoxy-L-arabinose transferase-like glycosyltransferase